MRERPFLGVLVVTLLGLAGHAIADVPLAQRSTWSGAVDFFATGAPLAVDGNDTGTEVDQLLATATVSVSTTAVPNSSTLVQGYLYWSGSITNNDCANTTNLDNRVNFTPPGSAAATEVIASVCYCSDAGVTGYDVQVCRADVTTVITNATTMLAGNYVVGGFAAKIGNAATDNASFSLVLVYSDPVLPPRRIALYDGVLSMVSSTSTLTLPNLDVDNPASGDLTWYTLEGDGGGSGTEQVMVAGVPGGASLVLSDGVNPAGNPMNHTINTVSPPRTDTIGVDIDRFDISAALTAGDTAVTMQYQAGSDKWWIAYNIVGVNVFQATLGATSAKTSVLHNDADANGVVTPGDTVRYTIRLDNTGTAPGLVDVTDVIPAQAASWSLVSAAGGTDASSSTTLIVNNVPVAVNSFADVVVDVVIANVPDNTMMMNTATFDAQPDGDTGMITAAPVLIRRDTDTDTVFDSNDNCPAITNMLQTDTDGDGAGDACDTCPRDNPDDADADSVCQETDNCPAVSNASQADADSDGIGDVCDACPMDAAVDVDADAVCQSIDNCPALANPAQVDTDADGTGDECDECRNDPLNDVDRDRMCADVDSCPDVFNADELDGDTDGDGLGDACDQCPDDASQICVGVPNASGCGCAGGNDPSGGFLLFGSFVFVLRRPARRSRSK